MENVLEQQTCQVIILVVLMGGGGVSGWLRPDRVNIATWKHVQVTSRNDLWIWQSQQHKQKKTAVNESLWFLHLNWSSSKRFLSLLPVFEPESTESRSSSQIYNFMTLFLLFQHKKRLRIKIYRLKIIRNPNKFSLLTRLIPITAESSQTSSSSQGLHRIEFPSQNFPVLAETLSSNQSGRFLWLTLSSCGVQQSDSDSGDHVQAAAAAGVDMHGFSAAQVNPHLYYLY